MAFLAPLLASTTLRGVRILNFYKYFMKFWSSFLLPNKVFARNIHLKNLYDFQKVLILLALHSKLVFTAAYIDVGLETWLVA